MAELFSQVRDGSIGLGTYDVISNYNILVIHNSNNLSQVLQLVISDIVTYDYDFQNSNYCIIFLLGYPSYLETGARVLTLFVLYITYFIQKHTIESYFIKQFFSIIGADSIIQYLFQAISVVEQDHCKILSQADTLSLVKTIKTLYSSNSSQELSLDMEIVVDKLLVVKKAFFTTITNKKDKGKERLSPFTNTFALSQKVPLPAMVVLKALFLSQPAKIVTVKPTPTKVATIPQVFKQVFKFFAQMVYSRNFQSIPRFIPAFVHPEYKNLLCFCDIFSDLPIKKVLAMYQSEFDISAFSNKKDVIYSAILRVSKMIIYRPIRY